MTLVSYTHTKSPSKLSRMQFNKPTMQQIIFYLAWFLCFSIPLPYAQGRLGFLSGVLFLLWLFDGDLKKKLQQLFLIKPLIILVLILGLSMLSLLWTTYLRTGLESLSPYKYYLLVIPPLLTSIPKSHVKKLLLAFVLGMLIHAIAAYLKYLFHYTGPSTSRIYQPYAIYGPFTAFCALYFFNRFLNRSVFRYSNLLNLILSISLLVLLFLMHGRSGQFVFLTGLLVLLVSYYLRKRNLAIVFVSLIVVITTIYLLNANFLHIQKKYHEAAVGLENAFQEKDYTHFGTRVGLLVLGLEAAKQNPLLGAGVGDLRDEFQRIIERGKHQEFYVLAYWDTPHNQYISQLVRLGLVGLLLLLAYIYYFLRLEIEDREYKILSIIFIVMFAANCFNDEILYMKPYNTYFIVMSTLFMNLASRRKIELDKPV